EIGRRERADWTDVNGVERVIVFQAFARMRGEHGVAAAINEAEHVVVRDLLAKPNATRAENAAFIVERHAWTELDVLRLLHFVFEKSRTLVAVFDLEFLQATFAGLVADRTIERMIDEQKFHHAAAAFFDQRRSRAHAHPFGHILRATNLRTWHPIDRRFAIAAELWFAIRPHLRHAHLDQTHSAIARRAELLVIAIARHVFARLLARFDHTRAFRKLMPDAVDLDVDGLRWTCCFVRHDESGKQENRKSF